MKKSQKKAIAVGSGIAALAAAAAGVYMMTGKNSKNRKKVATWAEQMQKDVVKELSKVEKASQATYNKVVDTVAKNYKGIKKVKAPELLMATADLKRSWDLIRSELNNAGNTVRRVVPKSAKSVSRKVRVTKKAAPKKAAKKSAKKAPARKTAAKKR